MSPEELDTRTLQFLEYLMMEGRVELGGQIFVLDTEYSLCVVAHNQDNEERLLRYNLGMVDLKVYRNIIQTATQAEMDVLRANIGLNKL